MRRETRVRLAYVTSAILSIAAACRPQQWSPFYYYLGEKIWLDVDSTQIVAGGLNAATIASSRLAAARIPVDSVVSLFPVMRDHVVAFLHPDAHGASAARAREALRGDDGLVFVSYVYRLRGERALMLPVNRLIVRLRDGASASAVEEIAQRYQLTIESVPDSTRGSFNYSLTWRQPDATRDPMEIATEISELPSIAWAELDNISDAHRSTTRPPVSTK